MAMIIGPGGLVYMGAQAAFGKLGGPLVVWDPRTNQVESHQHVIKDQSVISLTSANDLIIGGTTVHGGGGSHATQTQATLFIWDPVTKRTVFVRPVSASGITDLITSTDGLVYGFADDKLFAFDPGKRQLTITDQSIPDLIYNSMALGPDGCLWALSKEGIVMINPETHSARLVATAPEWISAGFAAQWPYLYYASGPRIYRYMIPSTTHCAPTIDPQKN